ncbi:MAG: N-6 DNA methylase [Spirochaetaceae bacterium]|jgi:hypothetical protein|nr:N-6 DNA methylase [Spirochaetaceae bacterium]
MKSIQELKEIWEIGKERFRNKEPEDLQNFIEDIFLCGELFALKRGSKSAKTKNNRFTRKTRKPQGRKTADFVMYINGADGVIPVEVEKLDHIRAGESQIRQYQSEKPKKYGLLTDGNEWRLYFDRRYETFYLADILDRKSPFWEKWKQYRDPEIYYLRAFNAPGLPELLEMERLDPCAPENRPFFFKDLANLLQTFKIKIAELFPLPAKEERQIIEITYSYVIQFILYKVLIDNNYKKLKNDYETFQEWIRIALLTGKYEGFVKNLKEIAEYIYKNVYEPFRQKQESINKMLLEQIKQNPALEDIAPWLDIIMFIDRYNFADLRNEIFGFVYENYLKELYQDENNGQYFTDPGVVNFMLQEVGYTKEALLQTAGRGISLIDPSCGAGTFLYSAALAIKEAFHDGPAANSKKIESLVKNNIFGLDIAEFPLFLAEINILMQLLPIAAKAQYSHVLRDKIKLFITQDSIAEFLDTPINDPWADAKDTAKGLFDAFEKKNTPPYTRNREDILEIFNSLEEDSQGRRRFDYVIGNPPYIGYNKCTQVSFAKKIKDKNDKSIAMNNVYGVNLHTVPNRRKSYPPKPNLYAFFIALGLGLLKDGGKLCYIIPQTMLTAGDLDVLRHHLAKYTAIEKIITFEGNLFIERGVRQKRPIPTSSLIFVVKKSLPRQNHIVRVINYKPYTEKQAGDFGLYFRSKNKETKEILQSLLLEKVENWNFIKQSGAFRQMTAVYTENSISIEEWRKYVLQDYKEFNFDVGFILDPQYYTQEAENNYPVLDFTRSLGYSKMFFKDYYPKSKDKIQLTRNSRYATLDHKYNIVCRIKNFKKFMLIDEPLIFNMGQAAIVSTDNKTESLFLFALLNSALNIRMLEANVKMENEKDFLVSIKSIKQYLRIPKITTENAAIKAEIIAQTEALLLLEKPVIQDFVNFPYTATPAFEAIRIEGKALVLTAGDKKYTAKIHPSKSEIVARIIAAEYFPKNTQTQTPGIPSKQITLEELRFFPAIDLTAQTRLKSSIDDLVFALYFNVPVSIGIDNATVIHAACKKNEFYPLVQVRET